MEWDELRQRRAKLALTEDTIMRFFGLPPEYWMQGVEAQYDPPRIFVHVVSPTLERQVPDSESPVLPASWGALSVLLPGPDGRPELFRRLVCQPDGVDPAPELGQDVVNVLEYRIHRADGVDITRDFAQAETAAEEGCRVQMRMITLSDWKDVPSGT